MKKFMVLYKSDVTGSERMAAATPEQMQKSMGEWTKWKQDTGDTLVDFGNPLQIGKNVTPTAITDGTIGVSGFSIIQAENLDEATKILQSHPQLKAPGVSIEVLEFLDMPGM